METVLTIAHNLTYGMNGTNPEYERGITEFISDLIGASDSPEEEERQLLVMYAIKGAS